MQYIFAYCRGLCTWQHFSSVPDRRKFSHWGGVVRGVCLFYYGGGFIMPSYFRRLQCRCTLREDILLSRRQFVSGWARPPDVLTAAMWPPLSPFTPAGTLTECADVCPCWRLSKCKVIRSPGDDIGVFASYLVPSRILFLAVQTRSVWPTLPVKIACR